MSSSSSTINARFERPVIPTPCSVVGSVRHVTGEWGGMCEPDDMSVLDEVLDANTRFADSFAAGDLPAPPSRHLAVLTCMDARILPLTVFGLDIGDAHVLRNAGGRVTDDALRSLLVSTHVLGVRAIAVVHHTLCGMASLDDEQFRAKVEEGSGRSPGDLAFHAIGDPEEALRHDVGILTGSGLFPPGTEIRGMVYDVQTGRLRPVV
jgi:carbonic anhydrase